MKRKNRKKQINKDVYYPIYNYSGDIMYTATDKDARSESNLPPYNPERYERILPEDDEPTTYTISQAIDNLNNKNFKNRLNIFRDYIKNPSKYEEGVYLRGAYKNGGSIALKKRRYLSNGGKTDNYLYPTYFPNGEVFAIGTDANAAELLNMPPYDPLRYERIYYPDNMRNGRAIDIELSKLPQNATFHDRLNMFRNFMQTRNNAFRNNYNTIDSKKRRK